VLREIARDGRYDGANWNTRFVEAVFAAVGVTVAGGLGDSWGAADFDDASGGPRDECARTPLKNTTVVRPLLRDPRPFLWFTVLDQGEAESAPAQASSDSNSACTSLEVKLGDLVKRGQMLAHLGTSGNSTEPHLHFQIADAPSFLWPTAFPTCMTRSM
jgi:hypothetical protein